MPPSTPPTRSVWEDGPHPARRRLGRVRRRRRRLGAARLRPASRSSDAPAALPRRGRPLPAGALPRARDRLDPVAEAEGRGFAEEAARAVRGWAYATLGLGHARQLHRPRQPPARSASPSGSAPSPTRRRRSTPGRPRGMTAAPRHRDRAPRPPPAPDGGLPGRWPPSSPPTPPASSAGRRRASAPGTPSAPDVGAWELMGFGAWAVEEKATGAFAGQVGLNQPAALPRARDRLAALRRLRGPGLRHRGRPRRPRLRLRHARLDHRRQLRRPRQRPLDRGGPPPRLHRGPGRRPLDPGTSSSATPPRRRANDRRAPHRDRAPRPPPAPDRRLRARRRLLRLGRRAASSAARCAAAGAWHGFAGRRRRLGPPRLRLLGDRGERDRRPRRPASAWTTRRASPSARSAGCSSPGFEGHGFATEAARAARAHAYGTLGWPTAVSYVDADNHRSAALALRLGCTEDPARRAARPAGPRLPPPEPRRRSQ